MKVLILGNPNTGVAFHRLLMPITYMMKDHPEDSALFTNNISGELLDKGWDVVVMSRALNIDPVQMFKWKKDYRFKLIVDNDDYWELDPFHPLYQFYTQQKVPARIVDYIRIADVVTCTHSRLAEKIKPFNYNVEVLPNGLPFGDNMFDDKKEESDRVRLFWSGSDSHFKDLQILRNPMKRVYSDYNLRQKITVNIGGYDKASHPIWSVMVNVLTNGEQLDHHVFESLPVDQYMNANRCSDISLIPLIDSVFNSCKSNLKVLEAACKKNPAIVSKVDPYMDMPVSYVENQGDWYRHIKNMVNDKSYREVQGQTLHRWCLDHFNLMDINKNRYQIFNV